MNDKAREQIEALQIWDDGGETIDRYSVVWPDGSYIGMNGTPFHPQGFCQHGKGAQYDPECKLRGNELRSYLGKMIGFTDLPQDCREVVTRDILGIEPPPEVIIKAPKLSDGAPSTLGTYLRYAKAIAPGSKFEKLIRDKITESANGEKEIVIVAESQMMYLLGQMLDPAEEATS